MSYSNLNEFDGSNDTTKKKKKTRQMKIKQMKIKQMVMIYLIIVSIKHFINNNFKYLKCLHLHDN